MMKNYTISKDPVFHNFDQKSLICRPNRLHVFHIFFFLIRYMINCLKQDSFLKIFITSCDVLLLITNLCVCFVLFCFGFFCSCCLLCLFVCLFVFVCLFCFVLLFFGGLKFCYRKKPLLYVNSHFHPKAL